MLEGGKTIGTTNLSSMYPVYMEKPRSERVAYLRINGRTALTTARELPEDFEAARPDLRVKLWSRSIFENQRLKARLDGMGEGFDIPHMPVGEHLVACIAYDWPDSTQSVSSETLRGWSVTIFESLEAGKANLAERMVGYSKIGDNLASFISGDSYDACRLLLVDLVRDMGLTGRPIAVVPNRDFVYITG